MINKKTIALLALKLAISLLICWWVFRQVEWEKTWSMIASHDSSWLALAVLWGTICIFFAGWRWHVIAGGTIGIWNAFRLSLIAHFYGTFLPGSLTGDVAKGAILAAEDKEHRSVSSAAAIVADRFVGLSSMLLLTVVACLWSLNDGQHAAAWKGVALWTGGALAVALGGMVLLVSPWFRAFTSRVAQAMLPEKLAHSVEGMMQHLGEALVCRERLPRAALLSLVVHGFGVLQCYAVCRGVGLNVDYATCYIVYSLLGLTTVIPVTMSGVGVRDWVSLHLFASSGQGGEAGVAVSLLLLAASVIIALIGALAQVGSLFKPSRKATPDAEITP